MPTKASGRAGSWPSASTMVAENFTGRAVSVAMIGPATEARRSWATFTASAVCGSITTPSAASTARMVATRSAWVEVPEMKP